MVLWWSHMNTFKKKQILTNVLCVPSFSSNIISVKNSTNQSYVIFSFYNCFMQDLCKWNTIGMIELRNGLFHFLQKPLLQSSPIHLAFPVENPHIHLWHARLAHPSVSNMKFVISMITMSLFLLILYVLFVHS